MKNTEITLDSLHEMYVRKEIHERLAFGLFCDFYRMAGYIII
jgi:hypothetical protein